MIVVGQEPGYAEEDAGEPFVGPSGRLFNLALERVNAPRSNLHITNAALCRPAKKETRTEQKQAYACCRPRLVNEIAHLPSTHIAALGGAAMTSTSIRARGIYSWMGSEVPGGPGLTHKTVVPILHPAAVRRALWWNPVMVIHLARAWGWATGTLDRWIWPPFIIDPGPFMVGALEQMLKMDRPVAIDNECQGDDPMTAPLMCIGLSNGAYTVSVPWDSYASKRAGEVAGLMSYPEALRIHELVTQICATKPLVFQNGAVDILGLKYQAGIECVNWAFDTLTAHRLVAPRLKHKLDIIALIEFHCENWKALFGVESDQKGLAKFVNRDERELRTYNCKDAFMTWKLKPILEERLYA